MAKELDAGFELVLLLTMPEVDTDLEVTAEEAELEEPALDEDELVLGLADEVETADEPGELFDDTAPLVRVDSVVRVLDELALLEDAVRADELATEDPLEEPTAELETWPEDVEAACGGHGADEERLCSFPRAT